MSMSLRTTLIPLAASLCLIAPMAWAQGRMSLLEAIDKALTQNPRLQAAQHQIAAARARETQAEALPNPNVTLMVDQAPFPNPLNGNYMAGVSQPLLLGGQQQARTAVAALDTRLAELDYGILRQDTAAKVRDAYARLMLAQESQRQAHLGAEGARALLQATEARYKAGEVARVEVLQAQVEFSRSQRDVTTAANRLVHAKGLLNLLLGQAAHAPIELAESGHLERLPLAPLEVLVQRSLSARLEIQRAQVAIQREALQLQVVRSSLWTGSEVSAAGGAVSGQPGFSATVTVPIPVNRHQGEIAEAEADRRRAEAERLALQNEITLEVQEAYGAATSALQLIDLFQKTYQPQAEKLADNARRRFQAGEGSGFEVMEAQRSLRETQTAHQQALLEHRQAIARLERAVGSALTLNPTEKQ
jgi:cobalt-zinc-cadmium efflux system outer membrane protein